MARAKGGVWGYELSADLQPCGLCHRTSSRNRHEWPCPILHDPCGQTRAMQLLSRSFDRDQRQPCRSTHSRCQQHCAARSHIAAIDASGHPMILICPNDANAQSMTHERGAQVSASRMPSPLGKRLSTPANNNEYARDAQEMM